MQGKVREARRSLGGGLPGQARHHKRRVKSGTIHPYWYWGLNVHSRSNWRMAKAHTIRSRLAGKSQAGAVGPGERLGLLLIEHGFQGLPCGFILIGIEKIFGQ
jgi:hypothetical protein